MDDFTGVVLALMADHGSPALGPSSADGCNSTRQDLGLLAAFRVRTIDGRTGTETTYRVAEAIRPGGARAQRVLRAAWTKSEMDVSPNRAASSICSNSLPAFFPGTTAMTTYRPEVGIPIWRMGPNPGAATM
jgi:hypothetical protein